MTKEQIRKYLEEQWAKPYQVFYLEIGRKWNWVRGFYSLSESNNFYEDISNDDVIEKSLWDCSNEKKRKIIKKYYQEFNYAMEEVA